jgi:membrane-bound lytic murein transglycosylase D
MKRLLIIFVNLLAIPALCAYAQYVEPEDYISTLKTNIKTYGPPETVLDDFCAEFEKNINALFTHDEPVQIGTENYKMTDVSLKVYYSLQAFDYKTKCRLLWCMTDSKSATQFPDNIEDSISKLAYIPAAIAAFDKFYSDENTAFGTWALHYLPAARYGIVADSCYDERLSPQKSSKASGQYLFYLHQSFGSWDYAVTAYVCGPAKLRKAMIGTKSFEETLKNLEPKYRNSFYILLAIIRWMEENETEMPVFPFMSDLAAVDNVIIEDRVHFAQIAEVMQIDLNELLSLNPYFTGKVIDGRFLAKTIYLPHGKKEQFLNLKDSIYNYKDSVYFPVYTPLQKPETDIEYTYESNAYVSQSPGDDYEEIKHKIVSGDNLSHLAVKYNVKVSDLKEWNNLSGENIYIGNTLSVWVKKGTAANYTKPKTDDKQNKTTTTKQTQTNKEQSAAKKSFEAKDYTIVDTYIVKSGDSLYKIALNYSWATAEDIVLWNNITDPSKLQIGQKLKIYKKK